MTNDEFLQIFTHSNLFYENFAEREVEVSFATSMMTQVEEVFNRRHMKMDFVEFLEAIARCSHILSLPPPPVWK